MNEPARKENEKPPATPLELMTRRSKAMLLAERLLRLGAALATLGLAFLALSWSGLWLEVGAPLAHRRRRRLRAGRRCFCSSGRFCAGPPRPAPGAGAARRRRTPADCGPPPRSRTGSPATRPIPRRRRCGSASPPAGASARARSGRAAATRACRGAIPSRCARWRWSRRSPPPSSPARIERRGCSPRSIGAARASLRDGAASTPGSIRRPIPAARRWCSARRTSAAIGGAGQFDAASAASAGAASRDRAAGWTPLCLAARAPERPSTSMRFKLSGALRASCCRTAATSSSPPFPTVRRPSTTAGAAAQQCARHHDARLSDRRRLRRGPEARRLLRAPAARPLALPAAAPVAAPCRPARRASARPGRRSIFSDSPWAGARVDADARRP